MSTLGARFRAAAWPEGRVGRLRAICFGTMAIVGLFDLSIAPFTQVVLNTDAVRTSVAGIVAGLGTVGALLVLLHFARRDGASERVQWWLAFIADLFALLAMKHLMPLAITVATYVVAPYGLPLCDAWLAWPEQVLGLTHASLYAAVRDAGALAFLTAAYGTIPYQYVALPVYFGLVHRSFEKVWEFAAYSSVAATAVIGAYWLLPGVGAYRFYGFGPPDVPPVWLAQIEALRTGGPFSLDDPQGLICFPSFHTVFAILLTWAYRDDRYVLPFVAALNFVVLLSIVPVGWHYLSDVAGGVAWAAGAVIVTDRWLAPKVS